ncbi:MAG: hypothetical protein QXU26_03555 [Thermofilaceae archaeon]
MADKDTPVPVGKPLRVWVELLDGREIEIHSSYHPDFGWDLPMGARMQILRIKAWQLIDTPTPMEAPVVVAGPEAKVDIKAQPRELPKLTRLILVYRLEDDYRRQHFIQTGQVLGTSQVIVWEPDFPSVSRTQREAFLWLATEYGPEPIDLGSADRLLDAKDLDQRLLAQMEEIKAKHTQELYLAHRLLSEVEVRMEMDCYHHLVRLRKFERLIKTYGDDHLQELYQDKMAELYSWWRFYRDQWIEQWGSPRLRYLRNMGLQQETDHCYIQERLQKEYPGFRTLPDQENWVLKGNVQPEEWKLLSAYPQGKLVVLQKEQPESGIIITGFLGLYSLYHPLSLPPQDPHRLAETSLKF